MIVYEPRNRKKKIAIPEQVAKVIHRILKKEDPADRDKEHFWVVGFNADMTVKYIELVSLGILNHSLVHPREVFRTAITKAVDSIILCHNHPSGSLIPSTDDLHITSRLKEAGKILGIEVRDHIIINGRGKFASANVESI